MDELRQEWQELKKYSTLKNWSAVTGIVLLLTVDWTTLLMEV